MHEPLQDEKYTDYDGSAESVSLAFVGLGDFVCVGDSLRRAAWLGAILGDSWTGTSGKTGRHIARSETA